jgi:TrmH family RNA methyltransferase
MISSTGNSLAKQAAALGKRARSRRESGLFLVEGPKMFEELPKDRVEQVFVTERFLEDPDHQRMVEQVDGKKVVLVTGEVLKSISDTQTPQGVAAVARQYQYSLEDIRDGGAKPLVMFLETIQDPGNLGTILRAGEAAGVTGVIMDRESADIYNPKVIRSTMGSVYRVPFLYVDELGGTVREFKGDGLRLYAAHLDGKHAYDREDYRGACGFLVGNEAKGLRRETADLADAWVRIPMKGNVESLNAAVASALLMFEAARQRRG